MPRKKKPTPVPKQAVKDPAQRRRARLAFRAQAEALNPSPFLPIYNSHGRLRHKPRHVAVKV